MKATNIKDDNNNIKQKNKLGATAKKVVCYALIALAVLFIGGLLYPILEFLLVGALLFLAWVWPKRRW